MEALVALGSNVEAERNVPRALRYLAGLGTMLACSQAWRTPPHGPVQGGPFLNLAAHVTWHADLDELRHALKRLERALGRVEGKWLARPIDLDVVALREPPRKGWTLVDDVLQHPFLWRPLAEVAPTLAVGNRTAADLAKGLDPAEAQVVRLRAKP